MTHPTTYEDLYLLAGNDTKLWVLKYKVDIVFEPFNAIHFVDKIVLSSELRSVSLRLHNMTITRGYEDRVGLNIGNSYDISVNLKGTLYELNSVSGHGCIITSHDDFDTFGLLDVKHVTVSVHSAVYRYDFKFHIMLAVMDQADGFDVKESKRIAKLSANVQCGDMILKVYKGIIGCSNIRNFQKFVQSCERIIKMYNELYDNLIEIFDNDVDTDDMNGDYYTLAYPIWYNVARQNQRQWPRISSTPLPNYIEYPTDTSWSAWYGPWYDNEHVELVKRSDDSVYPCVPKLYTRYRSHSNLKIPTLIQQRYPRIQVNGSTCSMDEGAWLDYNGDIFVRSLNKKGIKQNLVYCGHVIGSHFFDDETRYNNVVLQITDDNGRVKEMVKSDKTTSYVDTDRVREIPSWPPHYRQILHDYVKLGLVDVNDDIVFPDLMNVGIVTSSTTHKIRIPRFVINDIYISTCLQTERSYTFRVTYNVFVTRNVVKH
jgi:hypothetical protein